MPNATSKSPEAASSRSYRGPVARSWVSADVKRENLLYVSDGDDEAVWIFSYPKGKLKGMLYGFGYPHGACVDKLGDIFITDAEYQVVFEYPHGSAKPNTVLIDKPYSNPNDCSVDPTTGDLAVAHVAVRHQRCVAQALNI
jgi:sugar lactone lactonase YvrE